MTTQKAEQTVHTPTPLNIALVHPDSGMLDDVADIIGRNGWGGLASTVKSADEALIALRNAHAQLVAENERLKEKLAALANSLQTLGENAQKAKRIAYETGLDSSASYSDGKSFAYFSTRGEIESILALKTT